MSSRGENEVVLLQNLGDWRDEQVQQEDLFRCALAQRTHIQRLSPEQRKGSSFIHLVGRVGLSRDMKLVGG